MEGVVLCVKLTDATSATSKLEEIQQDLDGTHIFGITKTWCGELTFQGTPP